ncbi:MAG TPA: phosphate acyltransferase PlsX [Chloroflexota bacterium]|nr:phosphate acyltransferase PlsX [Chloroflexota bacterium]
MGLANARERTVGRRIAVDAMGGDHAPAAPVAGAVAAAREYGLRVDLIGPAEIIRAELARHRVRDLPVAVIDAPEVIGMAEAPAVAVRQKRRSSLVVGIQRVACGLDDAFVSAGNSGAVMAAALLGLQRIPGVARPALGAVLPTARGRCLLLDVGANADCKPEHLAQFALMGAEYAERVLGIPRPRVALLSIGEEASKGNQLVREAHPLLRELPLRFVGNVEGKDIPLGHADVIVTDGFTGNVVLKFAEGTPRALAQIVRAELLPHAPERIALPLLAAGALAAMVTPALRRPAVHTLGAVLLGSGLLAVGMAPAVMRLWRRLDWGEHGGVPLLGVNGVCIIAHGRSHARAIKNAIRVASEAAAGGLVEQIAAGLRERRAAQVAVSLQEIGI